MPDKPFLVLLHMVTSLEASLFIAISDTIYGIFLFVPHSFEKPSTIHIHSNVSANVCLYVRLSVYCITPYYCVLLPSILISLSSHQTKATRPKHSYF